MKLHLDITFGIYNILLHDIVCEDFLKIWQISVIIYYDIQLYIRCTYNFIIKIYKLIYSWISLHRIFIFLFFVLKLIRIRYFDFIISILFKNDEFWHFIFVFLGTLKFNIKKRRI